MQTCRQQRTNPATAIIGSFALLASAAAAPAQEARVVSGTDSVVVDGDFVRIRSGAREVAVGGAWRQAGAVLTAADTEKVLVDLGAVVADGRIQLNLAGDILFDFDSVEIAPAAAARLGRAAQVIRAKSVGEVHVIGHTDSKGSDAHNARLSRERALAVMRWLNGQAGIPTAVMVGSGAGAKYPVAHNTLPNGADNPDGRARNRRVEIQMATREGVAVGPGLVTIGPGRITTPEAVIDTDGVTTGQVRVDLSRGGVAIRDLREADGRPSGRAPAAGPQPDGAACTKLCEATAGKHTPGTIGCVEAQLEELGFDMDEGPCDELENAMLLGLGNEGGRMCKECQRQEGFGDAHCATVSKACFPSAK
ncbi:MAG: OmpA family protein [Propionibacteriaceae bacterium]|nr:OmpA family protein [Propionibacteriaceae bacterium]